MGLSVVASSSVLCCCVRVPEVGSAPSGLVVGARGAVGVRVAAIVEATSGRGSLDALLVKSLGETLGRSLVGSLRESLVG